MKYILVTGGVISGVGKGVIASSFGAILKNCGKHVTSIKIDPYINIDAGTFSPYEHGEVYVLDDGGEVDLDLGNYERFLDVVLHKDNNITTGIKIIYFNFNFFFFNENLFNFYISFVAQFEKFWHSKNVLIADI